MFALKVFVHRVLSFEDLTRSNNEKIQLYIIFVKIRERLTQSSLINKAADGTGIDLIYYADGHLIPAHAITRAIAYWERIQTVLGATTSNYNKEPCF